MIKPDQEDDEELTVFSERTGRCKGASGQPVNMSSYINTKPVFVAQSTESPVLPVRCCQTYKEEGHSENRART